MPSKRPLILLLVFILTISLAAAVPTVYGSGVTPSSHLSLASPHGTFSQSEPDRTYESDSGLPPVSRSKASDGEFPSIPGLPRPPAATIPTLSSSLATDRAALTALYDATDGDNWTRNDNWLSDASLNDWYGVTIGVTPEGYVRVTGLSLADNGLVGEIPAELANLSNLTMIRLAGNQLTGCLPANWQPAIWREEVDNDFASTGLSFCETPTPEATSEVPTPETTSDESGKQAVIAPQSTGGASKMYWTDQRTHNIRRSNLDGSQVEVLVDLSGTNGPTGIALDVAAGKMYWASWEPNEIQRANLDGSQVETLITSGLTNPGAIALDVAAGKMYWHDQDRETGRGRIRRANLDGSQVEDLVRSDLSYQYALALDVAAGKMYWTDFGTDKIRRANLNGSQIEDLVTSGLSHPLDLALDVAAGKMYWADDDTGEIQRANLDGSQVEDLVTSGLDGPSGLALDVAAGKMYWTDVYTVGVFFPTHTGKIQRANLDGSQVEDLVTSGLKSPVFIRLDVSGGAPTPLDPCVEDLGTITEATERQGSWASDCASANRSGSYTRYYAFTLDRRTPAQIDLTSFSQNPYLYLMRDAIDGTIVSRDGDGGEGSNSRITRTLGAGIPYFIEVTTQDPGQAGDFTLTVTPSGGTPLFPPGLQCMDDLGALTQAASRAGTWASDCPANNRSGSYARYYSFELTQETQVTIDLASSLDTVVYLLDGANTGGYVLDANDDVSGTDYNSRIVATLPTGRYTIEATTYNAEETGSFTLTVSGAGGATPPPPAVGCDIAEIATDGNPVSGAWANDCQSAWWKGNQGNSVHYARYYQFTLKDATKVTVLLESDDAEPVLFLRDGAGVTSGEPGLGRVNFGESEYNYRRAEITQNLGAGTYTIEATTYNAGETGSFTLTVSGAGDGPGPDGCAVAEITADGNPVSGAWANDCPAELNPIYNARYYQFTLDAAAEVTITLTANSPDPVLRLREGVSKTGTEIAKNDGIGPAFTRAEISVKNLDPGTYTIEARTYRANHEGPFTLTVSVAGDTTPPPTVDVCYIAEIATDGNPVSGAWASDCPAELNPIYNARYYKFTLDAAAEVTITLENDIGESTLTLREGESKKGTYITSHLGFHPDYKRAEIVWNLDPGTYTIEARTFSPFYEGPFTLTVSAAGGCEVVDLGFLTEAASRAGLWASDCESTDRKSSYARYYQFMLTNSVKVSVVLESFAAETVLYLRAGAGTTSGTRIGFTEGESEYNFRRAVIEQTLGAGTYTIEATTYNSGKTGNFMLTVSKPIIEGSERAALTALYHATNGDNWRNNTGWLTDAPLDDWYGVTTEETKGVVSLNLSGNRLSGELPADLDWGALNHLEWLNLSRNRLTGAIPPQWGDPDNPSFPILQYLNLRSNRLSGLIPPDLGNQHLTRLYLYNNQLIGTIPPRWGEADANAGGLPSLRVLDLNSNRLTGPVPQELGNLQSLEWLNLEDNLLMGPIPPKLGSLEKLRGLSLGNNRLYGTIPWSLGNLRNLRFLYLNNQDYCKGETEQPGGCDPVESRKLTNYLHGEIPIGFNQLTSLRVLNLSRNRLSEGTSTPGQLGSLSNLITLDLSNNQLGGTIPTTFRGLANLTELDLSSNLFDGRIPGQLGLLSNLITLDLSNNLLEGDIPLALADLSSLDTLLLAGNLFDPMDDCLPEELIDLSVSSNDLHQLDLPLCLSTRTDRRALLSFYHFMNGDQWTHGSSGAARNPWTQGNMNNWQGVQVEDGRVIRLQLPDNNLGTARTSQEVTNGLAILGRLSELETLQLNDNGFRGKLPPELLNLSNLVSLDLSNNRLTGALPEEWSKLSQVYDIKLQNNQLTGSIPAQLVKLIDEDPEEPPNLRTLYLADNDFSGCIPVGLSDVKHNDVAKIGLETCGITISDTDYKALVAIYDATGGDSWTNKRFWKENRALSKWYGVTIQMEEGDCQGRVIGLNLSNNNLAGEIPSKQLSNLECLTSLNLSKNRNRTNLGGGEYTGGLTGRILLGTLGNLTNLTYLNLSENRLSGEIPWDLGNLSNLAYLDLSSNRTKHSFLLLGDASGFEGEVPFNLRNLSNLRQLYLSGNRLTGGIEDALPFRDKNEDLVQLSTYDNPWEGDSADHWKDFNNTAARVAIDELKGKLKDAAGVDDEILKHIDNTGVFAGGFARRGAKKATGLLLKVTPVVGTGSTFYDVGRYLVFGGENPYNDYVKLAFDFGLGVKASLTNVVEGVREASTRGINIGVDSDCADNPLGWEYGVFQDKGLLGAGNAQARMDACACLRTIERGTNATTGQPLTDRELLGSCCNKVQFGD